MKKNLGSIDRVLRIVLALVLGVLFVANVVSGTLAIILGVVAVTLMLTSGMSFCPLYAALGWSTTKRAE